MVPSPQSVVANSCSRTETTQLMSSKGETEVEKLLRMARELRAQAEESEKQVHEQLEDKRADKEVRLGGLLNFLFYDGTKGKDVGGPDTAINNRSVVVEKLMEKNPSRATLEQFVDWLDDRRGLALGYEHVEQKEDGTYANVKGREDRAEADRMFALTETLLDALEVIDSNPQKKKNDGHLGGGDNATSLRQRLRAKRRENDEQYLERQQSFVEAQTIKEGKSKYEYHDEFLDDRD